MKLLSTANVAELIGVSKKTLLRWVWGRKVPEPKHSKVGGLDVRLWSERDVTRAREYKEANFRKGRGRKKSEKTRRASVGAPTRC